MHHNPRRSGQRFLALEIWQNLGVEVEQGGALAGTFQHWQRR